MLTRKSVLELEEVLEKQNIKVIKKGYEFCGNYVDIHASLIIPGREPMETTYLTLITKNSKLKDVWSEYNEK